MATRLLVFLFAGPIGRSRMYRAPGAAAAFGFPAGCKTGFLFPNVVHSARWFYLQAATPVPASPFVAGMVAVVEGVFWSRSRRFFEQ
jgi:hypothetical protein